MSDIRIPSAGETVTLISHKGEPRNRVVEVVAVRDCNADPLKSRDAAGRYLMTVKDDVGAHRSYYLHNCILSYS